MPLYNLENDSYGTEAFRKYMIDDLVSRGHNKTVVTNWMKKLSVQDIRYINEATWTEKGKEYHQAANSLKDLESKITDVPKEQLKTIKDSIQRYNIQYRGQKRLVYVKPDDVTRGGLQNKFIELTDQLVRHPLNFGQLVTPNSTAELKDLATEIKQRKLAAKSIVKENEKSPTFLRSFVGSLITRERYLTAKRMVGISALHTTFHAMAQMAGIEINEEFDMGTLHYLVPKKQRKKGEKTETSMVKKTEAIKIKLDHHGVTENGTYKMGYRNDTDNLKISDAFSEATSGFVDGAKDPFVFDLNFSLLSAGTWFYLKHHGVPTKQIGYLLNQPIVDQYLAVQAKNRSSFKKINNDQMTREEMLHETIAPWYYRVTGKDLKTQLEVSRNTKDEFNVKNEVAHVLDTLYKMYDKFSIEELEKGISAGGNADPSFQLAVLASYLRYEAQASRLTDFIISIGYDTQKTKTVQENFQQISKWNRVVETGFISNPEAIMDKTFLGELKRQKEDIPNMFKNYFLSLDPEVQKVYKPLYDKLDNPDYFIMKDDASILINRYQNHVLNYILHTTKFKDSDGKEKVLNNMYKEMFFGENSVAKKLYELKRSDDPEIKENLFIRELLPMISDKSNDVESISLFRSRMDTFDINNIIESLNNLREYGKQIADKELIKFTEDITKFSILQSGVQTSGIDYKKVLSTELYSELIKTIFTSFKKKPNLDVAQVWRTFHQNNWTNRVIVPKAPGWIKLNNDGAIAISQFSSASDKDFYIKYIRDPKITSQKSKELQKSGRGKELWIPKLFQRTEFTDETGVNILYYPIDVLGDGRKFTEIYTDVEQDSVLDKNRLKGVSKDKSVVGTGGWMSLSENRMKKMNERFGDPEYLGGQRKPDGKGVAIGEGKNIAMRKKSDTVIIEMIDDPSYSIGEHTYEVTEDMTGRSPAETSLFQISAKNEGVITKKGKTFSSFAENPKTVMLARNKEYKGRPLLPETKKRILDLAGNEEVVFLVGDMPEVDSQFVEYLQTIGATYDVYYSGTEPRFNPEYVKPEDKKKGNPTALTELIAGIKKEGTTGVKTGSTYSAYKTLAEEKSKKPITKLLFDKLSEKDKKHLMNQLKNC